ncbi:hypothetical protein GP486_000920 [Trichoglossum hirsutum]|uniref:Uncharacterized protein n=1 Tax=Trichoglossum hirsutum TaxID=265104 RepID=A0A9P8RT37_9PEZI|nr:hypothetical protein GP486_000920 [Trichoglossum hirsutum]
MTVDYVRKQFTLPLLVHILASERLRQDAKCFIERGPYEQQGPTLDRFLKELHSYRSVRASDYYLDGGMPTIGDLLDQAEESLSRLENSWVRVEGVLGHDFPVSPGSLVPTASPRELLIYLLANQPPILQRIVTGGDTVLEGDIGKHLNLPSTLQIEGNVRQIMPKKRVADGSPKMFFVCYHNIGGNRELFVGASQANWTGLPEIGRIRREDRDLRLSSYIPLATRALNALRQTEENAVLPMSMASLPKKAKEYQVRMRAIAAMINPPHPDFLGRTREIGQPFDRAMRAQQCCYACKGMMGYRVPAEFSQDSVESNLRDFSWKNRGNYPHSCAEVEASLQCSSYWMKNGKDVKY